MVSVYWVSFRGEAGKAFIHTRVTVHAKTPNDAVQLATSTFPHLLSDTLLRVTVVGNNAGLVEKVEGYLCFTSTTVINLPMY